MVCWYLDGCSPLGMGQALSAELSGYISWAQAEQGCSVRGGQSRTSPTAKVKPLYRPEWGAVRDLVRDGEPGPRATWLRLAVGSC